MGADDAIAALDGASDLWVAKGQRVVHVKLGKGQPADEELTAMMLGPTGNLRAPTLRRGKKVIVGFHAATYREVLG